VAKRDRCFAFLKHCEAQAAAADAEMKRLRERKASYENAGAQLKAYILEVIQSAGADDDGKYRKLEGTLATFSAARNSAPQVAITNEDAVPSSFRRITITLPLSLAEEALIQMRRTNNKTAADTLRNALETGESRPDKMAIRAVLEAGYEVPGAELLPAGLHLRVK
jgi:hypothetical protein